MVTNGKRRYFSQFAFLTPSNDIGEVFVGAVLGLIVKQMLVDFEGLSRLVCGSGSCFWEGNPISRG